MTGSVPAAKEVEPAPSPASTGAAAISEITPPQPVTASTGNFTVVILAREDSWLSIATDGKPAVEETLAGENQYAIHAQHQIVIKAGNVGALDFVFNGKKLPAQGDYGDVKTLTFDSSGLQPKAPAQSVPQ
jgi:hypothetical protein